MADPQSVTPGWRTVGMCWDGEAIDLEGVNPWEHEWVSQSERIVRFAAGEMSNQAWAFFLPVPA